MFICWYVWPSINSSLILGTVLISVMISVHHSSSPLFIHSAWVSVIQLGNSYICMACVCVGGWVFMSVCVGLCIHVFVCMEVWLGVHVLSFNVCLHEHCFIGNMTSFPAFTPHLSDVSEGGAIGFDNIAQPGPSYGQPGPSAAAQGPAGLYPPPSSGMHAPPTTPMDTPYSTSTDALPTPPVPSPRSTSPQPSQPAQPVNSWQPPPNPGTFPHHGPVILLACKEFGTTVRLHSKNVSKDKCLYIILCYVYISRDQARMQTVPVLCSLDFGDLAELPVTMWKVVNIRKHKHMLLVIDLFSFSFSVPSRSKSVCPALPESDEVLQVCQQCHAVWGLEDSDWEFAESPSDHDNGARHMKGCMMYTHRHSLRQTQAMVFSTVLLVFLGHIMCRINEMACCVLSEWVSYCCSQRQGLFGLLLNILNSDCIECQFLLFIFVIKRIILCKIKQKKCLAAL